MDILVVGSGGREHALVWKLKQSPRVGALYVAPGNGGTRDIAENVPIGVMDFDKLAHFAEEKKIGLTIVGPDDPLGGGIVDFFRIRGLRIWGPVKAAAELESSKAFSKTLMGEDKIPTARFKVCSSPAEALAHARLLGLPVVVKASGLALGKGVYICGSIEEAEKAIHAIMVEHVHGDAGNEVVVEEFLNGPEISIHALSDGLEYTLFPASQDHKRALEHDEGPNTGGMGAYAPVPWVSEEHMAQIEHEVVAPTFNALRKRGIPYQGILYPGLIMTLKGPRVLEYNARFGDPECQAYMRLLESDLLDLLEASVDGTIFSMKNSIRWHRGFAVNIVLASAGYPGEYKKGLPITGIEEAAKVPGVVVFHAGTAYTDGRLVTSGGRVLGISALDSTLEGALKRAYEAADKVQFEGKYYRRDIGAKSLSPKLYAG